MRLFVGLDIDDPIRERIARFLEGVREFAPDARWVRPESLHITLKFIGEQKPERLDALKSALAGIHSPPTEIAFRGYGFFPSPRSARVFWVGIEADPNLAKLAAAVEKNLVAAGLPAEQHAFSPHLTLARGKSAAPQRRPDDRANSNFRRLQEKLAAMPPPDFGTMTAREFFLYESKLSPSGSRYSKLERFALS